MTEAIAHWVLRQFDLPITNLLLASGGHFYILAPYSETQDKLDTLRRTISQNLWKLHGGDLSCILASVPVSTDDFEADNFSNKWRDVSEKVHQRKQEKWSEMNPQDMFENFFEPHGDKEINWGFGELGRQLREAAYLVSFEVPESPIPENPDWHAAMKAFGLDVHHGMLSALLSTVLRIQISLQTKCLRNSSGKGYPSVTTSVRYHR